MSVLQAEWATDMAEVPAILDKHWPAEKLTYQTHRLILHKSLQITLV